MSQPTAGRVTQLLREIGSGNERALDELLPLVYEELRRLARRRMAHERPGQTLQPTALVHEAFLRLVRQDDLHLENRAHFFTAAAEAMRRILIERARRHARLKRGGDRRRVSLADGVGRVDARSPDLLALDEALGRLEERDTGMAEVVKLRFFAGLTIEETARALNTSERSVSRSWTGARTWLHREMSRVGDGTHDSASRAR